MSTEMEFLLDQEAAEWFDCLHDASHQGDPNKIVARSFIEWLRQSPQHVEAFLAMTAVNLECYGVGSGMARSEIQRRSPAIIPLEPYR